jgi:cytochrome c biogenesis factor
MDPLQCPEIPGNAVVRIVAAKHLVKLVSLLLDRQVPHPPHLVLQMRKRSSQSYLLRTHAHSKVAFLIAGAVQSEAQKINRLRTSTATLARVSLRKATKFDEFGFRLRQMRILVKPIRVPR